jgi:hypothetical protein
MGKKYHRERVTHHPEQKKIRGGKFQLLVDDEYYFDDF